MRRKSSRHWEMVSSLFMNLGSIIFICKEYYLQCYSFRLNSTIFYFHLSPKTEKNGSFGGTKMNLSMNM